MSVHAHEVMKAGGSWLAAARSFVQRTCKNGSEIHWNSDDVVSLTMKEYEEAASYIAAAAINAERERILRDMEKITKERV